MGNSANTVNQSYFCELPFAEQLILWCIRIWVRGYELRTSVDERLFEAFSKVRIPRAAGLLDKMMRTIVMGHNRVVEIHSPCYRLVGNDERTLLNVIARYQAGHQGKAWFPLRRFLRPNAAQCLDKLLDEMAGMLTAAGLKLVNAQPPLEAAPQLPPIMVSVAVSTRLH